MGPCTPAAAISTSRPPKLRACGPPQPPVRRDRARRRAGAAPVPPACSISSFARSSSAWLRASSPTRAPSARKSHRQALADAAARAGDQHALPLTVFKDQFSTLASKAPVSICPPRFICTKIGSAGLGKPVREGHLGGQPGLPSSCAPRADSSRLRQCQAPPWAPSPRDARARRRCHR